MPSPYGLAKRRQALVVRRHKIISIVMLNKSFILLIFLLSCRRTVDSQYLKNHDSLPNAQGKTRILEFRLEGGFREKPVVTISLTSDPFNKQAREDRINYYNEFYMDSNSVKIEVPAEAIYGEINFKNGTWYPFIFSIQSNAKLYLGVERGILWKRYQVGYGRTACSQQLGNIYSCPSKLENGEIIKIIKVGVDPEAKLSILLTGLVWFNTGVIYLLTSLPIPFYGFFALRNEVTISVE
ncbi:hypothetical protein [Leptospira wolffii]|uniref:hypothetical protein n=1 Tax=Leptospira wolffii TaxID=409998 RepID=UPI0018DD9010|nr:hypothetical protein [Leptospira wolffii]